MCGDATAILKIDATAHYNAFRLPLYGKDEIGSGIFSALPTELPHSRLTLPRIVETPQSITVQAGLEPATSRLEGEVTRTNNAFPVV